MKAEQFKVGLGVHHISNSNKCGVIAKSDVEGLFNVIWHDGKEELAIPGNLAISNR